MKHYIIALFVLLSCTACTNVEQKLPQSQTQTQEQQQEQVQNYTVLNKEVRGDHYILEIASQDQHEYVELAMEVWEKIKVGDTVGLNDRKEVVRINNKPI